MNRAGVRQSLPCFQGSSTQEDPIGLAGGMNLYGYAGGDPVNHSDPFGLSCEPSPCFNPLKFAVGAVNAVRGTVGVAVGVTNLTIGVGTSSIPVLGPGFLAMGTAQTAMGFGGVSRGAQQMGEAMSDPHGPSVKNLLGLLPMGQEFDDPLEPGMIEFFKNRARAAVTDPAGAAKQSVCDILALRTCAAPAAPNEAPPTQSPQGGSR